MTAVLQLSWPFGTQHLPLPVRAAMANKQFDHGAFDDVCALADDVFVTCKPSGVSMAAAIVVQPSLDETQPAIPYATVQEFQ